MLSQRIVETHSRGKAAAEELPQRSEEEHAEDCFSRALAAIRGFDGLNKPRVQSMVVAFTQAIQLEQQKCVAAAAAATSKNIQECFRQQLQTPLPAEPAVDAGAAPAVTVPVPTSPAPSRGVVGLLALYAATHSACLLCESCLCRVVPLIARSLHV